MEVKKKALYTDVFAIVLVLVIIIGVGCYLVRNVLFHAKTEVADGNTTSWSIHISWDADSLKDLTDQLDQLQKGDPSAWGKKSEVKKVRFFAAGPDLPKTQDRQYKDRFDQQEVQYIYTEVAYKNAFYKLKDGEMNVAIQYFNPDGSLLAENKRTVHPKKTWSSAIFIDKCGYEERGEWQPGKYKIKIFIEGDLAGETLFEIYQSGAAKQVNLL